MRKYILLIFIAVSCITKLIAQPCTVGLPYVLQFATQDVTTGQSFTASCSGQLKTISLNISSVAEDLRGTSWFLKCNIKTASNTIIATGIMPNGKDTTNNVYPLVTLNVDFSCSHVLLTSGTQYIWEIVAITTDPVNWPMPAPGLTILSRSNTSLLAGGNYINDGVQAAAQDIRGFNVIIDVPNPTLTATQTQTNPSCGGCTDGSASVVASGGTGTYTYSWTPSGGTSSTATGLGNGTYTCTINSCGQSITKTFTLLSCTSVTTSISSQTNVNCNGASTGAVTINASGGSGFTYTWSPSGGNSATASGLSAGVYTCVVTNSCGATATNTVTITQPASALATATAVTNIFCFGNSTGAATLTPSGGTSPYTYLWSTAATTSVITGQIAGVKTVTVTDANGCTTTNTVTITQPASGLTTSTAVVNVLCFGAATGAATVTANSGTSPYTYLWSSAQTTSVITSLMAGARTVTVTDASGCTATNTVTITQPASALATATVVTNIFCFGNSTGAATLTTSGGTSPYTYLWSTAATTSVITGQTAGVKTVTVTDANSCSRTNTVSITQPASALATATAVTNIFCFGNSTGAATLTPSGGTSPYTYLWSTAATTSVITGQIAGVKTATVTDANGCTTTNTVTITQPASGLTTSTAVANVLCFGAATGAATVTANSGTSPYTYLWSSAQTTSVITSLMAGARTVTVTDASGCTATNTVTITQPASALATATAVTNVLCNGGSTGSATLTTSGGTSPYTYLWSTAATTSVITGQTAGVKTVTITDANSCSRTNTVSITQPASALATATAVTNIFCFGNSTGAATLTTIGGTAPYTYLWSTAATTSVITGQIAGVKTATVTDANGCTTTNTVTITQPASALATATAVTNVLCFGAATGAATVTANSGTSPYTYLWSSAQTTSVITSLMAGVRTVTVTDASGCTATNTLTITQPASALATATAVTNVLCNGGSTGSATLTTSGGTSPYTYLWSTAATTSVITGQTAGVKTVTVTDANSCSRTNTVSITQPASALATATAVTNIFCFGNSTGAATLTTSGGTAPYTYLWSTAATTSVITGQIAGVKTATVTDANGCTTTNTVTITQPASGLTTSTTVVNVLCFGAATGAATVTANSGTSPYTYLWSSAQTTSVITSLMAGVRTVTVTDASGCTATNTLTITQPASALATATAVTNVLCNGGSTGSATLTTSGGTSPYTYLWSTAATTSVITGQTAGVKTVTVTDANSCSRTNTVSITQPASALATATAVTNIFCFGNSTGAATLTTSGGTSPYTYLWSTAATTSVITGQTAGVKTATVTDANGCTTTNTVSITQPASGLTTSTAVANVLCNGGSTGAATVTANSGISPYTYLWSSAQTTSVITGQISGARTVTVTDASGCTATNTVTISEPTVLTATAVASNTSVCSGGLSTLTANAIGGTGIINYTWISGQPGNTTVVAPSSTATYLVYITDANSCATSATVEVTVVGSPTISAISSATICNGNAFTITPSGASTYTISGGAFAVSPSTTTSYTITGSGFGCVATNTVITTINVNSNPTITVNSGAICIGQSFTMVPSGASTYMYSSGSAVVTPTATSNYTVVGTDGNGCENTTALTVTVNAKPTITVNSGNVCSGKSYTLIPNGAVSYTYSAGSNTVSPTSTSSYTVTGTDANGCINVAISTVSVVSVNINANAQQHVTCFGGNNGSALAMASNGVGTYTYSWLPTGTNGTTLNNLVAGVYTCQATDAIGCAATTTVQITEPSNLVLSSTSSPVLCNGAIASVSINATGGTLPYNGLGTFTMNAGTQLFTVIDGNNCLKSITVNVSEPAEITKTTIYNLCAGQSVTVGSNTYTSTGVYTDVFTTANGCDSTVITNLTVYNSIDNSTQVTGGTIMANQTNATYQWINCANNNPIAGANMQSFTPIINGNYAVVVNVGNCSDTSNCVQITNVSVEEMLKAYNNIHVYPNPTNGILNIELGILNGEETKIEILNALGQTIMTETTTIQNVSLNISHLSDGMYFIKLNNLRLNKKIIKN